MENKHTVAELYDVTVQDFVSHVGDIQNDDKKAETKNK